MKTTKFFLIVALLSYATWTISQSINDDRQNVIGISLKEAMQNPRLVQVMHDQLRPNFLDPAGTTDKLYYAQIIYGRRIYSVYGTYNAWMIFFYGLPGTPPPLL